MSAEPADDRLDANRRMWDERAPLHAVSDFYDLDSFRAGRSSLQPFEVEELAPVDGLDLVHLQCHIGLDTLSWARLGARVTGLDFSAAAIDIARGLAADTGIPARFEMAEVTRAPEVLGRGGFDIVYTGHGALIWLPDLEKWADSAVALLRPGGRLYLAEFHPLSQMLGDDAATVVSGGFPDQPMVFDLPGSYAEPDAPTRQNLSYEWTHPLGEVVSVLAARGLRIEFLRERDIIAWPRWHFLEKYGTSWPDGWWRTPPDRPRIPLSYSLMARLD
ncbi:MAG TPA: class I SAM-dependent methyltransferase [Acidimicrobiales bacterium]|nr:class I SAM-dependent methyltransferase [Acidimicrobiales bacterium]